MPTRPADPRNSTDFLNDVLRQLREVQRETLRLPEGTDPLQTYENGRPLGDTRFLDFGPGIQSTLIGDNYVRISADAGEMPWDGVVDGSQTTNEKDRIFAGIGEALTYLAVTVGLTRAAVFVRGSVSSYTETANWTSPAQVLLFGVAEGTSGGLGDRVLWDHDGFSSTTDAGWLIRDFSIDFGAKATGFSGTGTDYFYAEHCQFVTGSMTGTPKLANVNYCRFNQCIFESLINLGNYVYLTACEGKVSVSRTLASNYVFGDLTTGAGNPSSGTPTLTMPADSELILRRHGNIEGTSGIIGNPWTINYPSGCRMVLDCRSPVTPTSSQPNISVTFSGSPAQADIRGTFQSITVPAPAIESSDGYPHILDVRVHSIADITGPALLRLTTTGASTATLRGKGIDGQIVAHDRNRSSGTWLTFVNADQCVIAATSGNHGTLSGTAQPYSFDASSDDNFLIFERTADWPAAGTDAGLRNVVLPEDFAGGFAGPHVIEDEGVALTQRANLNFVGAGVTVTDSAPDTIVTIPGGAGHVIEDEGVPLPAQPNLNFVGAGVTVTDSAPDTIVTISGGGGGGGDEPSAADWMGF